MRSTPVTAPGADGTPLPQVPLGLGTSLVLVTLTACDTSFEPFNEINGLRVLAIAEQRGRGEIELSTLVVGASAPEYRWTWCPITTGASRGHTCAVEEAALPAGWPAFVLGAAPTAMLRFDDRAEALAELCAWLRSVEAPNDAARPECVDEVEVFIRLEVHAGGEHVAAMKPVVLGRLQGAFEPNQNPSIEDVYLSTSKGVEALAEGASLLVGPSYALELVVDESAAEGPESLRVTWFVEHGETERERTAYLPDDRELRDLVTNTWHTEGAPAGPSTLYFVIRDSRGGTSWLIRALNLEETP